MTTPIALALVTAGLLLLLLRPRLLVQRDGREPPAIYAAIPFFGHIVKLSRQGAEYLIDLEHRFHQGLYTIFVGSSRFYVATSPEWAQAVHRVHKSLDFHTIVAGAMEKVFLMDKPSMEIIRHNMNAEDGSRSGLFLEMHDMLVSTLLPGPHLDDINKTVLRNILSDINHLATNGPQQVQLYSWLRHHLSVASTKALWGPKNPFSVHPSLVADFWEFEGNLTGLMMSLPSVFARKAWKARQRICDSFEEYMVNDSYRESGTSQVIRSRADINIGRYGFTQKMNGYGDVGFVFGALSNTVPSAFWLLSHIFEDPQLLVEIRAEVDNCTTFDSSESNERTINVQGLQSACPMLHACLRENLRVVGSINLHRIVTVDTPVTNHSTGESFLLKKDARVIVASNVIHQRDLWGSDAAKFNPRRFLSAGEKTTSSKTSDPATPFRDGQGKMYSGAFRSFGGGRTICPGRYFAQTEMLGLTSLFVAGFEIEGANTPEVYKSPPFESSKMHARVLKPGKDVNVKVSRRKGYENVQWAFET